MAARPRVRPATPRRRRRSIEHAHLRSRRAGLRHRFARQLPHRAFDHGRHGVERQVVVLGAERLLDLRRDGLVRHEHGAARSHRMLIRAEAC